MGKQRKTKNIDLTVGNITSSLWKFAVPLMLGNVLQQLYNLVDTWVVGHYIGDNALAAVGSSYTLMTFLTSIVIGLCLGSSAFLSMAYGKKNQDLIRNGIFISAVMIGSLAVILTGALLAWLVQTAGGVSVRDVRARSSMACSASWEDSAPSRSARKERMRHSRRVMP